MNSIIEDLRNQRDCIVEKFQKRFDKATMETQTKIDEICYRISQQMDSDNSIEVIFANYEPVRYTQEQIDGMKANGKVILPCDYIHKSDGFYYHQEKVEKTGRLILSDNEEHNRFFRFCVGYQKHLDEYTPFYHVHDHFPYYPHRIYKSQDILWGAYINQFVDDFVYGCSSGEVGIKLGDLKIDSLNKEYDCVLVNKVHANLFNSKPSLISKNHKEVICYEGEQWYHSNRKVGEY